ELFSDVITRDRPSPPNFLLDESLHCDLGPNHTRKGTSTARNTVASKLLSELHGPVLKALIMDGHQVRRWRQHDPSAMLNVRSLRRLTLVNCENPILVPWHSYPPELEILEIVNPVRTYPINADLYLREQLLARPLSQFRTLKVLNLQHVGAPIREVLFNLRDGGKNLKVLRLHDREISGIDMDYRFLRHQPQGHSAVINCPFPWLLAHLCPNLQTLSLDITQDGLKHNFPATRTLASDSVSTALEPLLEELAEFPIFSVSEALRSLKSLQHLRLVTSSLAECNGQDALKFAERLWSTKLKSVTLVVSAYADFLKENIIVSGTQSEWCIMSRGSNDARPQENYNLQANARADVPIAGSGIPYSDSEPIYIIFSGIGGHYQSIKRAYNEWKPAENWSRQELKETIGGDGPFIDYLAVGTQFSTTAPDEDGILSRFGFTIVEKILTLPGPVELPDGSSSVHIVCDEQTLDISYVGTEYGDAKKISEGQAGSVVKSVEYVRDPEPNRIIPTVFTKDGKPIVKSPHKQIDSKVGKA
ncbi:MAG: hypothetical protein Q9226_005470, partial [Calogaya cf. arnoldii]